MSEMYDEEMRLMRAALTEWMARATNLQEKLTEANCKIDRLMKHIESIATGPHSCNCCEKYVESSKAYVLQATDEKGEWKDLDPMTMEFKE